jgi:type I restriction enzyme S subunit
VTEWPVRTLGEVCDFVRGVTYDKADARSETKSGFIPLLRATNITEKGLLREDFVYIPSDGVRADQKLMSGDALITIASGSASVVGRSVLVEDPGEVTFGAFCGVLRPSPKILPRYLSHFMSSRSVRTAWSAAAQGTNINNLKRDDILQTECLLPPLEEQKRIVALLDAATVSVTELSACYEQARTHANELFTSALGEALGGNPDWPVKSLSEIGAIKGGKRLPKGTPWSITVTSHPYIRATDIRDGQIRTDGLVYVPDKIWPVISRYIVEEGDVLITIAGTIGSVAEVPRELSLANLTENAARITSLQGVLPAYLSYFLRSPEVRKRFENLATTTTQAKLALFRIEAIQLSVPPLEEQKRIVAQLDSMRAKTSEMVAAYDAMLQGARNLRQSILEAAFAGVL